MSAGDVRGARTDLLGERVYRGVRSYLLSVARPGQRLDVQALARREKASLTPVRAALHRLTGEGLVEAHLSSGFSARPLSNARLRDLYDWNGQVLVQAAAAPPSVHRRAGAFSLPAKPVVVRDLARLFEAVGRRRDNFEIDTTVARLNDRLHRVRMFEPGVLGDGVEELRELARHLDGETGMRLQDLIRSYHERRLQAVGDILSFIEKSG